MPRVTTKGQVTIPKEIRETLGIEPGDEIAFEEVESGYKIQKKEPTTADGEDPFEKYRGSADSGDTGDTMPERMRRLRGEYPRDSGDENDDDESEANA
ncbi:AbrB/MazE/SpoVT family DNA-binding domain-containing protein [Natrialba sp. SSL1]|uniref:AbrB/MazE/SpoVT family DNA-binding domain-containing protein n=1 Tax=Natrialba sp. SSL1 TaxID=1869245 RepID=UPI0008F8B18E|nr:AbrB/MazE/SpoVT family DNA-binding domain-containing protein [Natrialba sp. SSL1]OIB57590.1 AbrB family transcriptional regulator [Natrialba sp. SSL1]